MILIDMYESIWSPYVTTKCKDPFQQEEEKSRDEQ
jgi:hypothetical protein